MLLVGFCLATPLSAGPRAAPLALAETTPTPPAPSQGETVQQALCRLIDGAAATNHVPVAFLTRLIWQESSFRSNAVSPAGAQGIAQFMPGTAMERGLDDPFDPEKAIPASAALLADLSRRFGNYGLAAAAYNGGPKRVTNWLAGSGGLPVETEDYVLRVTGRPAEDWAAELKAAQAAPAMPPVAAPEPPVSCLKLVATLRLSPLPGSLAEAPFAPWGVQLAGNFSKTIALASFERARLRYQDVLGPIRPMIIGTRLRTRGFRAFYRVRVPAASRAEASAVCAKIHAVRGVCVVLRS